MSTRSPQNAPAIDGEANPSPSDTLSAMLRFIRTPGRLLEFVRYAGASGVALVLDTSIFLSLVAWTSIMTPVAATIGYLAGIGVHYFLSVRYIFAAEKTGKSHRRLMAEFLATGVLGVVLTFAIIRLTVDILAMPPLAGKIVSCIVTFLAVYVARSAGVLAPRKDAETGEEEFSGRHHAPALMEPGKSGR